MFNAFDLNHDGTLSISEFLSSVRGQMNQSRLNAVTNAYRVADVHGQGIDPNDLRNLFHADRHPDVIQGKRSADQVLVEFLETFETSMNCMQRNSRNGSITLEEFIEYYANVSMIIDSDEQFLLVVNNTWNVNGGQDPYKKFEPGYRQQ